MLRAALYNYRWEISIAVLALATHLFVFFLLVNAQNGDVLATVRVDDGFYELAENIRAGNGFSWNTEAPYLPNTMRTPGYSVLLAGLIEIFGVTGAAIVQLLAATAIPLLGLSIARVLTRSRTVGIIIGIVLALDPTLAQLSFQFYTETVFLIVFFAWLLTILHYFKRPTVTILILSALFLGAAILIKASVQYIPLLLIPFILWVHGKKNWRQSVAHIGILLIIVGAILAPWILRNVQQFDTPALSTQASFVLYTNFAPAVLSIAEDRSFSEVIDTFLTPEEYRGDAITFANEGAYKEKALTIMREHPEATAFVMGKSLFTFFTNDGFYTLLSRSGQNPDNYLAALIMMRLVWIGITLSALIGACAYLLTKRSPSTIFVIILVGYFALISTTAAFGTNPRYRLPVDPIIISLAVVGASLILAKFKREKY
ncbi:hypothetical protein COU16_00150 [Candidatus Kaiserbacteria bacterium CG10_big_fil_rev_8_21_14_0_10_47_16]|uniref:Glycosyltransferase RgtA/B/C/D-like domain-containing protein n=1 Tax=Candidatus Kaiserbacteria bacterium CG10_big_fil_rev_8_21_14_0_10_47_16 TaxID=1974608 RepID=A0A2H0UEU9_9BACT|nr:MAG: hypothetical protein COU16_00150 [Candidatus Kaiserbacteria bacterium CG10_big_fil_rev_8_21_14_0_10_47_16]